jgi:hypothetical protein
MSQDDEPTDDELAKIENELAKMNVSEPPVIDIGGAYGMYELHSDRIRLLAAIVQSWAELPQLDHIREVVEHELKLTLAQPEPYKLACFAASRAAYEGEAVA